MSICLKERPTHQKLRIKYLKSESLKKSVFENEIDDDKNHAGEFDEDLNDIGDGYATEK